MTIYFISGAEGVGKSTLIKLLTKKLPKIDIHDFDEKGVPSNPPLSWRINTTKDWINLARDNEKKGMNTIIVGLSFPSEISNISKKIKPKYCLLDISIKERGNRLRKRKSTIEVIEDKKQLLDLRKDFSKLKDKKVIKTSNKTSKEIVKEIIKWVK